jgi:uncharacterized protein (TIRG00374 family)
MKRKIKIPKYITIPFSAVLALFLIYKTINFRDIDAIFIGTQIDYSFVLLAFFIHNFVAMLTAARLKTILHCFDIDLPYRKTFSLTYIGAFFSIILPGYMAGDLSKIYFTKKYSRKTTEIVISIFTDRLFGFVGLVAVTYFTIFWIFSIDYQILEEYRQYLKILFITISAIAIVGMIVLYRINTAAAKAKKYREYQNNTGFRDKLRILGGKVLKNRGPMFLAIIISVFVHLFLAINVYLITLGIGEIHIKIQGIFFASILSTIMSILPITPGGIGVRDITMAYVLKTLNPEIIHFNIIPIIFTLNIVGIGLIGSIFFLLRQIHPENLIATRH